MFACILRWHMLSGHLQYLSSLDVDAMEAEAYGDRQDAVDAALKSDSIPFLLYRLYNKKWCYIAHPNFPDGYHIFSRTIPSQSWFSGEDRSVKLKWLCLFRVALQPE